MENAEVDFFSNLYVYYYYGSYTKCHENWKEYQISCPFSKLYYICKGECELVIEGKTFHALPGMLFLIPAHTLHSYYHINDNYVEKYWMHFDLKTGDPQALKGLRLPFYVSVPESENIDSQFQTIISLSRQRDTASRLQEKAEILKLISCYIRLAHTDNLMHQSDTNPSPDQKIHYVIEYMNHHLADKICLDELARLLHVHPNYFIRMFKGHMGVPPLAYLNRLRVERAKSLLENTSLPVSDIMHQVGFEDSSTFSSFFKHYTGYNPSQFRKAFSHMQHENNFSI